MPQGAEVMIDVSQYLSLANNSKNASEERMSEVEQISYSGIVAYIAKFPANGFDLIKDFTSN